MNSLFAYVLEMSIAGSVAILAVLIFRFLLRKAPKWIVCALWGLAAFRLLFPFTVLQSPFSFSPPQKEEIHIQIQESFASEEEPGSFWASFESSEGQIPSEQPDLSVEEDPVKTDTVSVKELIPWIWIIGVGAMLVAMSTSYFRLKMRMASSVPFTKGIRQSERVQSPFILGIIRPVIYIPFGLDDWTVLSVIAHEKAHIRRGDHVVKPLAWLILSVHWFNPMLWISYALLCKDIEAACDEKVLADMNEEERRDYARALLKCSTRSVGVYACPLAFGELNVKERIKMTLSYKKPVFWVIVLSLVIALIATVGILSDPIKEDHKEPSTSETEEIQLDAAKDIKKEDWWGTLQELQMRATGYNGYHDLFDFNFKQDVFQEKTINKNDKNWSDPVIVAESFDDFIDILDGCLKNPIENQNLIGRVNQYFDEKAEEFNNLYPTLSAPNFFDDHVIMMIFCRPQDNCLYVKQALLEETEEENLKIVLDIAYSFPESSTLGEDKSVLKFYWIQKDAWNRYKNGRIEYHPTTQYRQPEWIDYEAYFCETDKNSTPYHIILRRNDYDENPLLASVYFGGEHLNESRGRYKAVMYPDGVAHVDGLTISPEKYANLMTQIATFSYPATEERNTLTIVQKAYLNGPTLATHVFKIESDKLIYDETASPDKIAGLPDGAVFTLKEPNF